MTDGLTISVLFNLMTLVSNKVLLNTWVQKAKYNAYIASGLSNKWYFIKSDLNGKSYNAFKAVGLRPPESHADEMSMASKNL
jgi:hypothetical protein